MSLFERSQETRKVSPLPRPDAPPTGSRIEDWTDNDVLQYARYMLFQRQGNQGKMANMHVLPGRYIEAIARQVIPPEIAERAARLANEMEQKQGLEDEKMEAKNITRDLDKIGDNLQQLAERAHRFPNKAAELETWLEDQLRLIRLRKPD